MTEQLKLKNQLCHRLYVASNAVIRAYRPHLQQLDITYPQYVVLMALWEEDKLEVGTIRELTQIDAGALTLILKKLKDKGLIQFLAHKTDKRVKVIALTAEGHNMKSQAAGIPKAMSCLQGDNSEETIEQLKYHLDALIALLSRND